MINKAIIIFVRNPVLGKVKTRIAAAAGDTEALRIYKALLAHTHSVTIPVAADKYVFYSDEPLQDDLWEDEIFHKSKQHGETLGDKMKQAFQQMMGKKYDQVIIIGSDCAELTTTHIENAFRGLDDYDAVIGPAADGGYYLLGIKKMIPGIFDGIAWSTGMVYNQTMQAIAEAGRSCTILPLLRDVDRLEDVPAYLLAQPPASG